MNDVDGMYEDLISLCGSAVKEPHATCNAVLPIRNEETKLLIFTQQYALL